MTSRIADYQHIIDDVLLALIDNDTISEEQQIAATRAIHHTFNELKKNKHLPTLSIEQLKDALQESAKHVLDQTTRRPR